MKPFFIIIIFISSFGYAQKSSNLEKYPVFESCETVSAANQQQCFQTTIKEFIRENFTVPAELINSNYKGEVVVLFEVKKTGDFQVIYIDAFNDNLKEEVRRVFSLLPRVEPATYNANPTAMQFRLPIRIPLSATLQETEIETVQNLESSELENIIEEKYTGELYRSSVNIPLSNELYNRFINEMDVVGTNSHTSSKPFLYREVNSYYNFANENQLLKKETSTWLGRKIWNEHLFELQSDDYWLVADFGVDLQIGKDLDSDYAFTYNNTRAAILQGGLGEDLNFYASVFESQGRFADYYNDYARSVKPDGGNPAIIPGRGIAKSFMDGGFDYPIAEGYLSYSPGKFLNFQFGHGRNFLGDGYRSLFLSDNTSPYPYFKLNTSFWRIKYTNIWMSLRDVRPEVTADGSFLTKYVATHYLSLNVTERLNLGFFESVIWQDDNNRGFDLNYLNPVIFYRAIEFSTGSRGGNALLGLSAKYKISNQVNVYSQLLIDEFSSLDIFGGEGSYKNKIGLQLGAKYYNAFNVENLHLQAEYNQVRPFVYSHNSVVLNYGHNNQSLAHLWGANFKEGVGIARYRYDRWYGSAKLVVGERGFNTAEDNTNYGGDIYASEDFRASDDGHEIGQGNTTTSFFGELEAGYIINPATNLKAFGGIIYRNFDPSQQTENLINRSTTWVNFGIRTDIFNWYFDY